jgi:hypothetical protein
MSHKYVLHQRSFEVYPDWSNYIQGDSRIVSDLFTKI